MTPVPPEHAPNPMAVPPPGGQGRGAGASVAIALAVVGVLGLCFVAALVAIAIPSFSRFAVRSRQSEVKTALKAAFTAEKAFFGHADRYSEVVEDVGFEMPGGRYVYAFSLDGARRRAGDQPAVGGRHTGVLADPRKIAPLTNEQLEDAIPEALWNEAGLTGTCPACDLTIVAAGNLDDDATADVWSISTKDRTIDGKAVPAGEPYNHVDDTRQ